MAATPLIELNSSAPEAIDGRHIRAVAFHDVRMRYVADTLAETGMSATGSRALVVGSGRGLLADGLHRFGFEVVAIDPSAAATEIARETYGQDGIDFRIAPAENLGLTKEERFDFAFYADTFEITSHLPQVLEQAARALRPGGSLVYDTVSRTLFSRLVYLGAFQALPMTRIMPAGRYTAKRLRTPREMTEALRRQGLRSVDIREFKPKNPRSLVTAIFARRRGQITDAEIPPIVAFELGSTDHVIVTYLGHAVAAE